MAKTNNQYDLKGFGVSADVIGQAALGYSRDINSKLRVGVTTKFLVGLAKVKFNYSQFDFNLSGNHFETNSVGEMYIMADPNLLTLPKDSANNFVIPKKLTPNYLQARPAGYGMAFDFGATYKPNKHFNFAAGLNDIGYMKWKSSSIIKGVATSNIVYNGFSSINIDSIDSSIKGQITKITDAATNMTKFKEVASTKDLFERIPFTSNVSAEYSIFGNDRHDILLGMLWNSYNRDQFHRNQLMGALTLKPLSWFTLSGTYELLREDGNRYGLAFNFSPIWANFFIAADYFGPNMVQKQFIPLRPFDLNITLGMHVPLGRFRDSDHDGVKDRKDKCPDTPLLIKVDKKGCPVDEDSDGVPDYKDQCPKTDKAAVGKVDSIGCPCDKDGDGVPDYLDKCPDTPLAARGMVNEEGCPLDSDKDGIFDYLDKCPKTPIGIQVDAMGCPMDNDGDGVTDDLDKCPGTPIAAKGKVDAQGCPLDTDGDGVPDYLDLCPDTPLESRASVNERGCSEDSDGDGVPNYLDKCPDTPKAAAGKVDAKGCPLDSDGDGVPDYLDLCPNTPIESRLLVDKNGCIGDSDGDGVSDDLDKCPNTPADARGKVDAQGCPLDTDGDGIADYLDNCPTTKGVASNFGCPELKKEVRTLLQKALQGIEFETGSPVIKPTSFAILNQIKKVLEENPTYLIEIRGHTDNVGKAEANLQLSEKRAEAVKIYLTSKGIEEKRMTSKGFGDTRPVASNATPAGKAKNRRVEFTVIFEEVKFE
jgi:outer membrane protein OmpA-like peptidoglycan-associated protein